MFGSGVAVRLEHMPQNACIHIGGGCEIQGYPQEADLKEQVGVDIPYDHGHQVDGQDGRCPGQPGNGEDQGVFQGLDRRVFKLADPGEGIARGLRAAARTRMKNSPEYRRMPEAPAASVR